MNSYRLRASLEEDGFDNATAETVVNLAEGKPLAEAQELLIGMLGEGNKHVDSYIANRHHAEVAKQKAQKNRIVVNSTKPKHQKTAASTPKVSNTDKVDSLKDLESAVNRLSIDSPDRKACDCMGSKHGLLEMAPNCLNCGRIVCKKEGLGPCMFCKEPLLPNDKIKEIVDILNQQKSAVIATMSKKTLIAAGIDPNIKKDVDAMFTSSAEAEANLERLLSYQDNGTVRTRIIDQVGEVDLPNQGLNQWATPIEQAEQLRQQQRRLRRLELERKARLGQGRKVLSIDVRGNKVYQSVEDAPIEEEDLDEIDQDENQNQVLSNEDVLNGINDTDIQSSDDKVKPVHFYDPAKFNKFKVPRVYMDKPLERDGNTKKADPEFVYTTIKRDADEDLVY